MPIIEPPQTACLVCSAPFVADWINPDSDALYDRHLVCNAHSEEALNLLGLHEVWGGPLRVRVPVGWQGERVRSAWATPPEFGAVYTLILELESSLLVIASSGMGASPVFFWGKAWGCMPSGLTDLRKAKWSAGWQQRFAAIRTAVASGWYLEFVQDHWSGVALRFRDWRHREVGGAGPGERKGSLLIDEEILALNAGHGSIETGLTLHWTTTLAP